MLFFDTLDGTNPFRTVTMIEVVEPAPVALSKTEWNAVRRCAEQRVRRDHGLSLALAALFRYAGPRVSEVAASWSTWPDGHLFLGQRGPLNERGIREIIAKLGQAAKLSSPLGPHDLRHTFAKSLLDPAAYGLDRPPLPLPAIQQLLGHADIATTTIYTRVSADELARMMGTSESL